MRRASGLAALAAVVGPGVLAGLSDDDPAGITTYSILGADYGYSLLWVLLISTLALIVFHELGARTGIATGQGLAGLVRDRFGVRWAGLAVAALVIANLGTTCAEFAGIAAASELGGVDRLVSVPIAAVALSLLVLKGGFRRIEHVLLALATIFAAYIVAGLLAGPDWAAAAEGLVVPRLPAGSATLVAVGLSPAWAMRSSACCSRSATAVSRFWAARACRRSASSRACWMMAAPSVAAWPSVCRRA